MAPPKYVFCMWNNRIWPAKVLSQPKHSPRKCRLFVEIFVIKEQINVSLTDTKPFLMDELQKIGGVLDRTKKLIIATEDRNYQRALTHAADIMKQLSCSASQSTGAPSTQVYEQKETIAIKKECKPSRIAIMQNKTKRREIRKWEISKQKDSDAEASKDTLEVPTAYGTRVSPTKAIAQKNKKRPLDITQVESLCGDKTVCDDASLADEHKSKRVFSVRKLRGCMNTFKDLNSLPKSPQKRQQKETKQRPLQRRIRLPSQSVQETNTDLRAKSSKAHNKKGNGRKVRKYLKLPDLEEEKGLSSSELSMEMSSPECTTGHVLSSSPDDTEEDIQLPIVMLQKEPAEIIRGSFVWCKFQHYPYWPSLVQLVDSKQKKVTIVFLDESISDPTKKKKSFKVALHSVKDYDCPEKQQLLENARKDYSRSIDWCDSLISDYRIRLGCGSFSGTFMGYCSAPISLPVRRELERGKSEILFPAVGSKVTESEQEVISVKSQRTRKLLPDRARAARDRANEKLVEFIVNAKKAEDHLLDILSRKKKSKWLKKFQSSNRSLNCLETYIEDEEQMELVVGYLRTVCDKMSSATKNLTLGDQTQFIFEVLIPETIIFAIAATEQLGYEEAEIKYLKGPPVTKRERRSFEEQILKNKRFKLSEEAKIGKDSRN